MTGRILYFFPGVFLAACAPTSGGPSPAPARNAMRPISALTQAVEERNKKVGECGRFELGWVSQVLTALLPEGFDRTKPPPSASDAPDDPDGVDAINARLRARGIELVEADEDPRPPECPRGDRYMVLSFPDGDALGEVPLTRGDSLKLLEARVHQLLKTPQGELSALVRARQAYERDRRALEQSFGIDFSPPEGWTRRQRLVDGKFERLDPYSPYCDGRGAGPERVRLGVMATVRLFDYIPGRDHYNSDSVYRSGELSRAFFSSREIFLAQAQRARNNSLFCPTPPPGTALRPLSGATERYLWDLLRSGV